MKIYKLRSGVLIENKAQRYALPVGDWENFINDDNILSRLTEFLQSGKAITTNGIKETDFLPPIGRNQELWACGVTYLRSKVGRQEESKASGGGDFYAKVYEAERPEVFFKAMSNRIAGTHQKVRTRKDSTWDVPEPELTLVVTSSGKIIGYTIGNDMSSRSIEGENPLYLPQAKTYDECAALGPCIYLTDGPLDGNTMISLEINRNTENIFKGEVSLDQMKRKPEELVSYVFQECTFPSGCLIMTGTGIVPGNDFTLHSGDEIRITIEPIGTLVNTVR
ncbi:MAG TPA: fumarylacetoacetate hydrolase family protein [Chitinophagaceae bacterium]|nr:fumarylacetoacetate hydrolase family protein [Chitinophagaceae bacterium]